MQAGLFDIQSATDTTLIEKYAISGSIGQISICNQHATTAITVDLYLDDEKSANDSKCYIIKNVSIPGGVTLLLDHGISFDSSVLALKIKTVGGSIDATNSVSVILK